MKQFLLCIGLAIAALAQTASPDPIVSTWRTGIHMNGRYWRAMGANEKIAFVLAYGDAIDQVALTTSADFDRYKAIIKPFWPFGLTGNEVASALDNIYVTPENGPIAISNALGIVSQRTSGADESTVQKAITDARARAVK